MNINDFIRVSETDENIRRKTDVIDGYNIDTFCYALLEPDFYNKSEVHQECRGIVFANERLIARPFKKFYNLGENPKNMPSEFNWNDVAVVLEKIDGCLAIPIVLNNKIYWKTKGSFESDEAIALQKFYENHENSNVIKMMIIEMYEQGYTPIFEFVKPNMHIIDYGNEEKLFFICMRNLKDGHIIYRRQVDIIACLVDALENDLKVYFPNQKGDKLLKSLEDMKTWIDFEGVVVYFNDGRLVKVKTDWYFNVHKLSDISTKSVIKAYLTGEIDDIKAFINTHDNIPTFIKENIYKIERFMYEQVQFLTNIVTLGIHEKKEKKLEGRERYDLICNHVDEFDITPDERGLLINTILSEKDIKDNLCKNKFYKYFRDKYDK